jgi:hypothetical protein
LGDGRSELAGQTDETLPTHLVPAHLESQPTLTPGPSLRHVDPSDLHLALVAVRESADVLCT